MKINAHEIQTAAEALAAEADGTLDRADRVTVEVHPGDTAASFHLSGHPCHVYLVDDRGGLFERHDLPVPEDCRPQPRRYMAGATKQLAGGRARTCAVITDNGERHIIEARSFDQLEAHADRLDDGMRQRVEMHDGFMFERNVDDSWVFHRYVQGQEISVKKISLNHAHRAATKAVDDAQGLAYDGRFDSIDDHARDYLFGGDTGESTADLVTAYHERTEYCVEDFAVDAGVSEQAARASLERVVTAAEAADAKLMDQARDCLFGDDGVSRKAAVEVFQNVSDVYARELAEHAGVSERRALNALERVARETDA